MLHEKVSGEDQAMPLAPSILAPTRRIVTYLGLGAEARIEESDILVLAHNAPATSNFDLFTTSWPPLGFD
jgi:hypothetical protein